MPAFPSPTTSLGPSAISSRAPGQSDSAKSEATGEISRSGSYLHRLTVCTVFTANSNGQLKSLLEAPGSDLFPLNVKLTVTFQAGPTRSTIDAPYNVDASDFTTVALHVEDVVGYLSETGWNTQAIEDSYTMNGAEPERRYAPFVGGLIKTAQTMKMCKKMGGPGKSVVRGDLTIMVALPVPAADPSGASTNSCAAIAATTLPNFSVPVAAAVPALDVPAVTPTDHEADGSLVLGGGTKCELSGHLCWRCTGQIGIEYGQ